MSEREKMRRGEAFDGRDAEIIALRDRGQTLLRALNQHQAGDAHQGADPRQQRLLQQPEQAGRHGIRLLELTEITQSLEDSLLAMTGASAEFTAV